MIQRSVLYAALWVLLVIGFLGALTISYANFSGTACPQLGPAPICYVVLLAYGLMCIALLLCHPARKRYSFYAGWVTAFSIAFAGSAAEKLMGGGVCPTSGGSNLPGVLGEPIPMCFLSLALTIAILLLFVIGPNRPVVDHR